jgi:RNA polymerase sigma-70 factor (ECF subfamily)
VVAWFRRLGAVPGLALRSVEVNGGPGALAVDAEQRVVGVCALEIAGSEIVAIEGIVNPDKLGHLGPTADLRALLRG